MAASRFAASKTQADIALLRQALAQGPRLASEVEAEAAAQGISPTTLREARKRLNIESRRHGGRWVWAYRRARRAAGVR